MYFLNITTDSTHIFTTGPLGFVTVESINVSNDTGTTEHSNSGTVFCGWALGIRLPFWTFPLAVPCADTKPQISITYQKEFPEIKEKWTQISNRYFADREQNGLRWTEKENGRNTKSVAAEGSHGGTLYVTALVRTPSLRWTEKENGRNTESVAAEDSHGGTLYVTALVVRTPSLRWTEKENGRNTESVAAEDSHGGTLYVTELVRTPSTAWRYQSPRFGSLFILVLTCWAESTSSNGSQNYCALSLFGGTHGTILHCNLASASVNNTLPLSSVYQISPNIHYHLPGKSQSSAAGNNGAPTSVPLSLGHALYVHLN